MNTVKQQLSAKIMEAREGKVNRELISQSAGNSEALNEFLFFIKPEITINPDREKLEKTLEIILDKIQSVGLNIVNITVLSAPYLEKHGIIAQHYGVINKISRNARENLSEAAKNKFKELYGVEVNKAEILGSIEFLKVFPEFTPLTLDYLWQNKKFEKLSGGCYSLDLNFNGRQVYLINGFHPRQLDHFTAAGKCIVTMTLQGNLSWAAARQDFIGATDPAKAASSSLRRYFLEHQDALGLPAISSSWNGVHLSAGPLEGLVELMRYNADIENGEKKVPQDYSFGKKLMEKVGMDKTNAFLGNISVQYKGQNISAFDLTEEKNSDEALVMLSEAL